MHRLAGCACDGCVVISNRTPVLGSLPETELVLGEIDQALDDARKKFDRSLINKSTCSRTTG